MNNNAQTFRKFNPYEDIINPQQAIVSGEEEIASEENDLDWIKAVIERINDVFIEIQMPQKSIHHRRKQIIIRRGLLCCFRPKVDLVSAFGSEAGSEFLGQAGGNPDINISKASGASIRSGMKIKMLFPDLQLPKFDKALIKKL